MKKMLSVFLACILCISFSITSAYAAEGFANFQKINAYTPGQFNDVSKDQWFAAGVSNAYELGVMQGNSKTTFNPQGNITIAQTITLAARLHSIYVADGYSFTQTTPWYQTYVDYAIQHEIIAANEYNIYTGNATRLQFASIIYKALPEEAYQPINAIQELPDLAIDSEAARSVLALYNAGIIAGNDKYGTFKPNSFIRRCEVAVIITRITDVAVRKSFKLEKSAKVVTASTPEELLNNICSDRKIILTSNYYNLSGQNVSTANAQKQTDSYYGILDSYVIKDVHNLTIEGSAEIVTNDLYADVLKFENCSQITLSGLTVGHVKALKEYECEGAVLKFDGSREISVKNCNLYGCGAEGIYADNTEGITVDNSKIYSCTYASIWLTGRSQATINNSIFCDSKHDSGFLRVDNSLISCNGCEINNITTDDWAGFIDTFDSNESPSKISFLNCNFTNNTFNCVTNDDGNKVITFTNCTFRDNSGNWNHYTVTYSGSKVPTTSITPQKIYTKASESLYIGETVKLPVSFWPANVTDTSVSWSSSNTKVATVDQNGVVRGVGKGTAIITVKASNGVSTGSSVTVNKRESILIGGTSIDCNYVGGVSPYIYWRNNSGKTIKYITFYTTPYNAVWDVVASEIGGYTTARLQVTGPIYPYDPYNLMGESTTEYFYGEAWHTAHRNPDMPSGFTLYGVDTTIPADDVQYIFDYNSWDCPWYNNTIRYLLISKVEIIYMDGTSETIKNPSVLHSTVWE